MNISKQIKLGLSLITAAVIAACGGGGGGGGTSTTTPNVTTLSGTAAVGYPLVGATVTVRCAAGTALATTTTDSQGAWSVDVTGQTLPCAAELTGGTANGVANTTTYHSIALARGVMNITPMTDLIVANVIQSATPTTWFAGLATTPTNLNAIAQADVEASLQRYRTALPLITTLTSVHPITDSFTATPGNSMDDMLEAIAQARTQVSSTHADDLAVAAAAGAIQPGAAYYSALVWKFRATNTGGNSYSASTIVTAAAPTPTYAGGSEELAAFNLLNAERSACGFGTLTQSAQVDAAARAHADWEHINWVYSHYENQSTYPTGFTGYDGSARITFQGYTGLGGSSDNIIATLTTSSKVGKGVESIRAWLAAPFHSRGLIGGFRDVGVAIRSNNDVGTANTAVFGQLNLAYKSAVGKQLPASNEILTYPCQGTSGVDYRLTGEEPNPVPGRDLAANPLGHPVIIKVRDGNTLSITTATMTSVGTNTAIALRSAAQTKADDTGNRFTSSEAYVIPDAPLSPNTTYSVTITGTNSSVPFTKTFTFTTGTGG